MSTDMIANLSSFKISAAEGAEYEMIFQKQLREERKVEEHDIFWIEVLADQVLFNDTEPGRFPFLQGSATGFDRCYSGYVI